MSASVAVDPHRSLARSVLRDAVDLYVSASSHDRIEMRTFGALVDGLLDDARLDDRRYVAETLATRDDVPPELMRRLATDVAEVARPVIVGSPLLGSADLAAALRRGPDHVRAVAERLAPIFVRDDQPDTEAAAPAAAPAAVVHAPEIAEPARATVVPVAPIAAPTTAATVVPPVAAVTRAPSAAATVETKAATIVPVTAPRIAEPAISQDLAPIPATATPVVVEAAIPAPPAAATVTEPARAKPEVGPAITPIAAAELIRRPTVTAPAWVEGRPPEVDRPAAPSTHETKSAAASVPAATDASETKTAALPHFAVPVRAEAPRPTDVSPDSERARGADGPATSFFELDSAGRWRAVQEAAAAAAVAGPARRRSGIDAAAMGDRLLGAAVAHDLPVLTLLLGDALDLDVPMAGRVLGDASGEPMAVALAAIGIEERRATSILLHLAGPEVTLEHMQDLAAMAGRIGRRTAEQLVAGWRTEVRSRAVPRRVVEAAERRPAPSAAPAERREVPAIATGPVEAATLERRDAISSERRDAPGPRNGERATGDSLRDALDRLARRISRPL